MTKLPVLAIALIATATAALAATEILEPAEVEVITIEVAPEDLARCQETLAQVAAMPVTDDAGRPLHNVSSDLPSVVCVATDMSV